MRSAVERGVFDEVSEAELVRLLENRPGVDDQTQLGSLLRLSVLSDVVMETVGQGADSHFGIGGERRAERGRRPGGDGGRALRHARRGKDSDERASECEREQMLGHCEGLREMNGSEPCRLMRRSDARRSNRYTRRGRERFLNAGNGRTVERRTPNAER